MYLDFSNIWGRTSAGGEQALVQKQGQVLDGGLTKISTGWGDPREKSPDLHFATFNIDKLPDLTLTWLLRVRKH